MENEKRTADSIENQRFFLITVYYENYLKNDVKLEKIFLIDYFQNDLYELPVKAFLKVVAVS